MSVFTTIFQCFTTLAVQVRASQVPALPLFLFLSVLCSQHPSQTQGHNISFLPCWHFLPGTCSHKQVCLSNYNSGKKENLPAFSWAFSSGPAPGLSPLSRLPDLILLAVLMVDAIITPILQVRTERLRQFKFQSSE